MSKTFYLPSSQTKEAKRKIPVNHLKYSETCPACQGLADPNDYSGGSIQCTCGELLPFEEQKITNLFGRNDITVHVPLDQLLGKKYELEEALNEHFQSDEIIFVLPERDGQVRVTRNPSHADIKFPCQMAEYWEELRGQIETKVGEELRGYQLEAMYAEYMEAA